MDRDRLLATLHDESTALLAAARGADPQAPVAGCPEWAAADLVWHIGEVHDFWGWIVRERATVPEAYEDPHRPGDGLPADEAFAALCTFASERAAELHRVLTDTDPSTPVWSWTPR